MNSKKAKTIYFIKKVIESVNTNERGIVFDSTVGGLLELSRQYIHMPNEIKKLAAPKLINSICSIVDISSLSKAYKSNLIFNKFIRQLEVRTRLIKQTKEGIHIPGLFNLLSKREFILGCLKNIEKVINNNEKELTEVNELELSLINELSHFLIDYLLYIGYSKEEIYAELNNYYMMFIRNEIDLEKCYNLIKSALYKKVGTPIEGLSIILYQIRFRKSELNSSSITKIKDFLSKILTELEEERRVKDFNIRETDKNILLDIKIYNLDKIATNNLIKYVVDKFNSYKKRVKYIPSKVELNIYNGNKKILIEEFSFSNKLNLKYFDEFWHKSNWKDISQVIYEEISRIDEWVNIIEQSNDKRLSFLSMWSSLEFILIGDKEGDKRQILYDNFIAYMGLYFFRKNIKVFFKNIAQDRIRSTPTVDFVNSCKDLQQYVETQLPVIRVLDINNETIANKFLYFLISKNFGDRWQGFDFRDASKDYYSLESEMLINNISSQINMFEKRIETDIDQMYRLRNMLTHGGLSDKRILDNTYDRLSYYVQTLINSISYTWIYSPDSITSLEELHHLKKYDYEHYKARLSKIEKSRNDFKGWTKLMDLGSDEFFVNVPKNNFKSYGVEH